MADYKVLTDTRKFIETFLCIRTKSGQITPFRLNASQQKLYAAVAAAQEQGKPIRIIILKARQMGFSTLTEGIIFHRTACRHLHNALIITHKDEATTNLFQMAKLFYEYLPQQLKPMLKNSNAKELIFENPTKNQREKKRRPGLKSKIKCTTAGGKGVGRSDTLNDIHMSEVAFWPGDIITTIGGLMQAVPAEADSMVIIESTANGFNAFKTMWDDAVAGRSDFTPLFFPWYEMAEYRMPYHGEALTAEEQEIMQSFSLDTEQIMWRRWCIANNCGGRADLFRQEYPSTPEDAFLTTGNCIFDTEKLVLRIKALAAAAPPARGRFTYTEKVVGLDKIILSDITFCPDAAGEVTIYTQPKPQQPYVIGGDTAGEGSDKFTAQVLDNSTGQQVAVLAQAYDEDEYAKQVYCLGWYYHYALVAVEVNFSTHPVRVLEQLHYPNLYQREVFDTYTGAMRHAFGFHTNSATRPVLVGELVEYFRDSLHLVADTPTLQEALAFIRNSRGRAEAEAGEHDDLLMGLGIALMARGQQRTQPERSQTTDGRSHWTADMWEDWHKADSQQRAYLEGIWAR